MTSFKTPYQVDKGPFYIPFVDFQPTLDAWRYILVELGNDTLRPYVNTVIVGLSSASSRWSWARRRLCAGPLHATAHARIIGLFIGCLAFAFVARPSARPCLAAPALGVFVILAQAIGQRFQRGLGNSDIAFWMISQRILPPIAVVHPDVRPLPADRPARQPGALIITYVAANLPIVVWLMRDYFAALPRARGVGAVDGASIYRIVRSIVLPISVRSRGDLPDRPDLRLERVPIALDLTRANAQTMPLQVAAQNATRGPQWWAMSVLILIMITPVVAMAILLERYITRGILVGSLKG